METLNHKGMIYIKASILAKRHRYTSDYIGQLCRQGKVDAQLVGRAWYVNEDSLLGHKIDRKKEVRPSEVLSKNAFESVTPDETATKIAVHPGISKKTHRQFFVDELQSPIAHHWQNRAVAYSDDPATLVPQVTNKIIKNLVESTPSLGGANVPVELVEAEKLSVKDVSGHNHREHLTFTPLPEVALKGDLSIESLEESSDLPDVSPVTIDELPTPEPIPEVARPAIIARYQKPVRSLRGERTGTTRLSMPQHREPLAEAVVEGAKAVSAPVPVRLRANPVVKSRKMPLVVPFLLLVSIVVTSLMLSLSAVTKVESGSAHESFSFNKSILGEALLLYSNSH